MPASQLPVAQWEKWLQIIGITLGVFTLLLEVSSFIRPQQQPAGREIGKGSRFLKREFLILATVLFILFMVILWKPIPVTFDPQWRLALLAVGSIIYFPSLALYLWGFFSLGSLFYVSSGFGVRLQKSHQLITTGPFSIVRHPMYLALILASLGMLLLFRTWASAGFVLMMLSLVRRAKKEEQALALEFGAQWQDYAGQVPAWLPHPGKKKDALHPSDRS
ncbi:MAG: isoprenylcysteine carboxylmethyltransferase family protein [Anaerolineales bacterium]|nr:isoprenylcysteine carboxylmethyltransferase family protein [Anaerolineales bacterium]